MDEPKPIVHVVDDDSSFLTSVARLLHASGYGVRTYTSASELLDRLTPDACGCIITDLQMPGLNGLDLQDALARSARAMPMVFLTGHGDIPSTVLAMRHGAEDFLTKRASKDALLAAVGRAMERDSRERSRRIRLQQCRALFGQLSPREREVLDHVVQGKLNKQIAADLRIHERTVKLHRTSITTKLNVHSVAELMRLLQEAGSLESQGSSELSPTSHA